MSFGNSPIRRSRVPGGAATGLTKSLSDSVTATDAVSRVWTVLRTAADTVTLSDAPVKSVGKPAADSITMSDATVKAPGVHKADSLTATDALAKALSTARSDTLTVSDAVAKALALLRTDGLTETDLATPVLVIPPLTFTFGAGLLRKFPAGTVVGLYESVDIEDPPQMRKTGEPLRDSIANYTVTDPLSVTNVVAGRRYYIAALVAFEEKRAYFTLTHHEWRYLYFVP